MADATRALADAMAATAREQGARTPEVRGSDWHTATVTAVGTGTVDCGDIRARRLDTYLNPAIGDTIVVSRSGQGNWVAAGRLATTAGTAWTSYTPTWTAGGTNPTLGNATLLGRYHKVGRTVHLQINLVIGSTTNVGSGNQSFALPFQAADSGCTYIGNAHYLGGSRWGGQFVISPGNSTGAPFFPPTSTDTRLAWMNPGNEVPEVIGSGDQLRITAVYESAS